MPHFASYNTTDPDAAGMGWTTLAASGTATLGPIETGNYKNVTGIVWSDQDGSFVVQQSWDGINWDYQSDSTTVTKGTQGTAGGGFLVADSTSATEVTVVAPYLRVVYTNGSTAGANLRAFIRAYGNRST